MTKEPPLFLGNDVQRQQQKKEKTRLNAQKKDWKMFS
jgi:hypothetical protein